MGRNRDRNHRPGGREPGGGGNVGVGMLRGVRRPRPSGANSRSQHQRDEGDVDALDAIELSPSDKGFRSKVLASVGLDGDEDSDNDIEEERRRWGRKKSGRRGKEDDQHSSRGNAAADDAYSVEEDDDLFDDDASEYESFNISRDYENSWRATINRIMVKLLWVMVAVAAIVYILSDDEILEESEVDEDVKPKEPYSYHGYKDGRIPDDDIAQYGGAIVGAEMFGIADADNETDYGGGEQAQGVEQHGYHDPTGMVEVDSLWGRLNGYAEMAEPYDAQRELPVFWHIPKCGGTTLQDLMMHCIGMVGANEIGAAYTKEDSPVEVVQLENGNRYVNVDMSNPDGIAHAKDVGLSHSGMANVVMTSWFDQTASVFDDDHKGRCFTMMRHPIRRAISMFFYLKDATWEHTYSDEYKNMTVEEYAASQYAEDNWMVRFLTNQMSGAVYERHLDLAKEVLESKCLVGILEEFKPSFKRFNEYFGWNNRDFGGPVKMNNRGTCVTRVMGNPDNAHSHPKYDEGGEVWNLLLEKNRYDVSLYEHALHLFHDVQDKLVQR